jgi:hypothetical protein
MARIGGEAVRIVEDSPTHFRMRGGSLWIAAICFAAALVAVGHVVLAHAPSKELIAAAFSAAFGLAFLRASDVTCDRHARTCQVSRFTLLGLRRWQFAFRDITNVAVETIRDPDGGDATMCRLTLTTTSGAIPLSASYQSGLGRHEAMREALVNVLFAGRSRPAAPDPLDALLRAGRRIDAIAYVRKRDGLSLTEAHSRVEAMRAEIENDRADR